MNLGELLQRSSGEVIGLDSDRNAVRVAVQFVKSARVYHVHARAQRLPFADNQFDLVFTQFAFLWFEESEQVTSEIWHVLEPGGVVAAIEPDFGGMMVYPPENAERDVWLDVLARSGSYPEIGRRLPSLLSPLGFSVDVFFFDRLENARLWRSDFLESLPITNLERERVIVARKSNGNRQSHVFPIGSCQARSLINVEPGHCMILGVSRKG